MNVSSSFKNVGCGGNLRDGGRERSSGKFQLLPQNAEITPTPSLNPVFWSRWLEEATA